MLTHLRSIQATEGGFAYPGGAPDAFSTSQVPAALVRIPYAGAVHFTAGRSLPAIACPSPSPSPSAARARADAPSPTPTPSPDAHREANPEAHCPSDSSCHGTSDRADAAGNHGADGPNNDRADADADADRDPDADGCSGPPDLGPGRLDAGPVGSAGTAGAAVRRGGPAGVGRCDGRRLGVDDPTEKAVMRRLALLLPAAILAALASLAPVASVVPGCAAAGSNHAALVVEHADGSVVTRCVAFDTDHITGEELLNRSGVAWSAQTFGGFGDAVCALDGEPAKYAECPGKDRYWAVFVARAGGSWQLANVGISTMTLRDGDAEGFRYVPASGVPAAPVSAAGVCAAAAATPSPGDAHAHADRPRASVAATTTTASPTAGATTAVTEPPASVAAPTATLVRGPTPRPTPLTATPPPPAPAPAPSGGTDLGLFAAAVAGGGLAGLALLRLFAVAARPR